MIRIKNIKIIIISCLCFCVLGFSCLYISTRGNYNQSKDNISLKAVSNDKDIENNLINENNKEARGDMSEKINDDKSKSPELTRKQLNVPQSVQENNYFCVPASLQMVLRYHGIEASQTQLAKEMNSVLVSGTEYIDLAKVANKYIFNKDNVGVNGPGYHVQTLNRYDTNTKISQTFEKRVKKDISTNDPVFVAIDVKALYPNLSSANHMIVLTGYAVYKETDKIAYYYYIDPSYIVQDEVYGGLKTVASEELINAIVSNVEPAYIW